MKNDGISLNIRLLAVLVLSGLVLCVGVFFLHRYQVKRQSTIFLREARAGVDEMKKIDDPLKKSEKVEEIGNLYSRYLIQNDDDLEVEKEFALLKYETAKLLLESMSKEKDLTNRRKIRRFASALYASAVSNFEEVLRKDPDQPELRAEFVDILFKSGNWTSAVEHIKFLSKPPQNASELAKLFDRYDLWKRLSPDAAGRPSSAALERFLSGADKAVDREALLEFLGDDLWMILDDSRFLSIYASCQAVQEKNAVAEKAFEKAVSLSPENPELYERLAYILSAMKPPRSADADYWMNEMVFANPESYDARLRRGRYWNRIAASRETDQQNQLATNAVYDSFGAMQQAITIIADEADRQSPALAETKALKQALLNLPDKAPASKDALSPDYPQALIAANAAALALEGKLKGISKEIEACRDGLFLAAQSQWLISWLSSNASADAPKDGANDALKAAQFYAENLTSLYPDYSPGYAVLSEIFLQAGDRDKAVDALRKGSKVCVDSAGLLWRLASLLIDADDVEGAKKVCKELEEGDSEPYIVNHLKARIAFSEGRWKEAAEDFEAVRDEVAARWPSQIKRTDYLLAECYGRLGRVDQQRDAYFRAASSDRTWLPALLGIAKTKARDGQIDGAIEDYRLILKLDDAPPEVAFDLASLLISKNMRKSKAERDWREVSEIIKSLQKAEVDQLRVALLSVDAYFAQGLDDQATSILDEAQKKLAAEETFLKTQLADAKSKAESLSGKEQEDARGQVAKLEASLRDNSAKQASVWTAIVKVAERKKDWDVAEKAIQAAREKAGDTVTMRLAQGEHLLDRIGEKAAEPLRSLAGNTAGFSKAARLQLWQGLAGLSLRAGDYEQANLLSRSVLKDEPGNRNMQMIRFEIAVQENDVKAMEEILAEIENDEKTPGAFWHYGQAMRLNMLAKPGDAKLFNEAQAHLVEALRIRPNWPSARLLSATLHDRQGNLEAAVEGYRKAIDLGVQSSAVIRRTVQLLAGLNRFREADEVLRLLGERQDSIEGEADFESSIIKARIGEYENAVAFARKAAAESKKASDHVWLGQLLLILGRQAENEKRQEEAKAELDEAEKAFEKAVELDPTSDAAWVSLIQFYGQTGKIQQAEEAIKKAQEKLPPEKAAVAIAQCYEAIGKNQDAEKQLLENLAASPRDAKAVESLADYYMRNNQSEKACEQLKKIIDGDVQADKEQKTKARRAYATMLFQQGGEENRKKALEMIEDNLRLNAASEADQYAKAVLLANDLSAEQRKKAIPVLEQLLDSQRSPSPEIQFTLAKLYLSEDQLPNFKNLMRNILRGEGREPRYLAFYVDSLIDRNEMKEAGIYLELLKKTQPNSISTAKLAAKFAFKLKNYETTMKVLREYLDSPQADKQAHMMDMVDVAGMLAGFADSLKKDGDSGIAIAKAFDDEAESIFQKFVDLQPGRELLMAQFLARQGRLKQALKLTEEHADSASADDVAKTCFTFLQGSSPNAEQLRQIDRILTNALDKHAASQGAIVLKTALAILRDFQQRDGETEALYRDILKEKPDDPTAMNNLAIFLALHNRNLDEAAKMIDKAILDNGRLPGLLDTRAIVYLAQNQPKKALDDLSLALKKQPTAVRYFHQAQAYFQDGQKNAAVKSFKMAQDMGLKESSLFGVERRNYQKLMRDLR